MARGPLIVVGAVILIWSGFALLGTSESEIVEAVVLENRPTQEQPAAPPQPEGQRGSLAEATGEAAPTRTRESVLAAHWGADWQEVKSKALDAGISLDDIVEPPPDWTEIEAEVEAEFLLGPEDRERFVRTRLGSIPDPLTVEWIAQRYDVDGLLIDGAVLADVQDTLLEHAESLETLVDEAYRELEFAVRDLWARRAYSAAPYFIPADDTLVPMCYSSSFVMKSWCVGYVVSLDEYPELRTMGKEIQLAVRARDLAVQAMLDQSH